MWVQPHKPPPDALRVRGLMMRALFSADEVRVRPSFIRLRELRERLRHHAPRADLVPVIHRLIF